MNCKQLFGKLWLRCRVWVKHFRHSLTGDFSYSTDFFFGLDLLMALAGVRLNSGSGNLRRCWNLYRWLLYLPGVVILWNTCLNVQGRVKLEIVLSDLEALLGVLVTILRMLFMLWHYEPLMEVRRYVNRRCFGRNFPLAHEIRSRAFYHNRKLVIRVITFMVLLTLSIVAIDLSQHHVLKLPFDVRENFPAFQNFCEQMLSVLTVGLIMMMSLVYLVVHMILTGLTAEVQVIAQRFAVIFDETARRVQGRLEREPGSSEQQAAKARYLFWRNVQAEFDKCIDLHVEFIAVKNLIKPLLNTNFLITYYATALILASGAIYLSQIESVTLFAMQTMAYCLYAGFECASLTRVVNLLTEGNESIGLEVYNLDWPTQLAYEEQSRGQYRSVRNAMTAVLMVAQHPLGFNCCGFFEFTQESFWELLNMAYNLYTFLKNFVST